jgi:fucose permease
MESFVAEIRSSVAVAETPSEPAAFPWSHLLVVILSYVTFVVLGLPDGIFGVAWPFMTRSFSVGLDAMGFVLMGGAVGFLLSSFTVGRWLARIPFATFLLIAFSIRIVAMLGYAAAPSLGWVVVASAIYGMGTGGIDAGMNTYFALRFSPRLMNWLHASFGLGATIGPLLMTGILSLGGIWRYGYVTVVVLQLALGVAVFVTRRSWLIPPRPTADRDENGEPAARFTMWQTLAVPAVWLGIAVFFFYTGVEVTAGNWSFTLLTEGRGVSVAAAGLLTTIYWGSFTLGRVVFGFVADRFPLVGLIRGCLAFTLLGAILLAIPTSWTALVGLILVGFALAPIFPLLISETPLRLGAGLAQHAIGFQVGAASLGIAVLPSLAGIIATRTSMEAIPIFLIAVVLGLITLHELLVRVHA